MSPKNLNLCLCPTLSHKCIPRPLSFPSPQTSFPGWSTSTCTAPTVPCTGLWITHSPTLTSPTSRMEKNPWILFIWVTLLRFAGDKTVVIYYNLFFKIHLLLFLCSSDWCLNIYIKMPLLKMIVKHDFVCKGIRTTETLPGLQLHMKSPRSSGRCWLCDWLLLLFSRWSTTSYSIRFIYPYYRLCVCHGWLMWSYRD